MFGLRQTHGHRPPVEVVQGQPNDFLPSQRQLGQTQRHGVVAPSFWCGPRKTPQKSPPLLGLKRSCWWRWNGTHRLGHGPGQPLPRSPGKLKKAKEATQIDHQGTEAGWAQLARVREDKPRHLFGQKLVPSDRPTAKTPMDELAGAKPSSPAGLLGYTANLVQVLVIGGQKSIHRILRHRMDNRFLDLLPASQELNQPPQARPTMWQNLGRRVSTMTLR